MTAVRLPWSRGTRVAKRRRRTGRIGRVIRRIRALPRALKILLAVLLVVLPLLAGGWLWFRDSQFVAVQQVTITGLSADAPDAVRSALTAAAREQTTLNFDLSAVRAAVAGYPLVADVRATTDFPHGAAIAVTERRPVAVAVSGKSQVPVAPDGLLLRGLRTHGLPPIAVDSPPRGNRLAGVDAQRQLAILAAAPAPLRARVERVTAGREGWQVNLRNGPDLVFGTTGDLRSKWTAAVSVLSDPEVAGASYIDLRVPSRPAVGGLPAEPGTGEIDPVTGMPAAQAETQATDPSTGETIDPATGAAVDPATTQAIDPTTGQAIDPATGAPVDPAAAAGSSGPSGPYGAG